MSTSVIGYPRIGSLRELKFALEAYFKGEKTEDEIKALAKELRKRAPYNSEKCRNRIHFLK